MDYSGENYLNKVNKNLRLEPYVQKRAKSSEAKNAQLRHYLSILERTHTMKHIEYLKKIYFDKYVIKEIPDSYISFLDKQYFDTVGRHITKELIKKHKEIIIENQQNSLSLWLEYFCSEYSSFYPMWAKVWAFFGMLKIGNYSKDTYTKRTNKTVSPFVELDREILARCMDLVLKYTRKEKIKEEDLNKLIENGNFAKLYTLLLSQRRELVLNTKDTSGVWVKYEQGENYLPLYNSLQGKNTKWCTAGESMCKKQIENGDFYVYYTYDENHEPTMPRIAIRMNGHRQIGEIRGIGYEQNIEENFESVLEEKLKEFPDSKSYKKRMEDIKTLTFLYKKYSRGEDFSLEELKFIYEIDDFIEGFGFKKDPRIEEIIKSRYIEGDIQKIIDSIDYKNKKEAIHFYLPQLKFIHHLEFPEDMLCALTIDHVETVGYLKLPKQMISLSMIKLTKVKTILFPEEINYLSMDSLESLENITLPKKIKSLSLNEVKYLEKGKLPEVIDGDLNLYHLEDLEAGALPKKMNGNLDISHLKSIKGKKVLIEGCKRIYINHLWKNEYEGLIQMLLDKNMHCELWIDSVKTNPNIKPNTKKKVNRKSRENH